MTGVPDVEGIAGGGRGTGRGGQALTAPVRYSRTASGGGFSHIRGDCHSCRRASGDHDCLQIHPTHPPCISAVGWQERAVIARTLRDERVDRTGVPYGRSVIVLNLLVVRFDGVILR